MNSSLPVMGTGGCHSAPAATATCNVADSIRRSVRRVQLFFPPMVFPKFQSRQTALFPLGLGYIASALRGVGHEVELIDCATEGYHTLTDIGQDRTVYGLTEAEIRARIERFRPEMIGLSCLFSTLERRMLEIARIAKEVDPNIVVVCGGPHVSAYYARLTRRETVDFCVIGEGEDVIVGLCEALNGRRAIESVHALCYRRDGRIVTQPRTGYIESLDALAYPARDLVDMERYFAIGEPQGLRLDGEKRVRVTNLTTSRGCPFQCTYCGKHVTWGKEYRAQSAEGVVDELEYLIEKYGVEHVAFQDDNFTADMDRAARMFDLMVERKLNVSWEGPNGLGVNFLSPELLEKMKASGCSSFTIAVESANSATLRRVKKPNYIKLAPPIVKKAQELGIEVRGFFMIGFPGETLDEVQKTVGYAREMNLAVTNFAIVTPLPGTPLFDELVELGMLDLDTLDFEDFAYGGFNIQLSQIPVEQLKLIRKIEWMRTMFMESDGNLKRHIRLKRRDVLDELAKGMALFPGNADIAQMHQQVTSAMHWGETEHEAAAVA